MSANEKANKHETHSIMHDEDFDDQLIKLESQVGEIISTGDVC